MKEITANIIINEAVQRVGTGSNFSVGEALSLLVAYYNSIHQKYRDNYERYKASEEGTPIFSRELADFMKVNNKVNNSFVSEIVDTKQGYMIGIPVTYSLSSGALNVTKKSPEEVLSETEENNKITSQLIRLQKSTNLHDLNMETIKKTSICGTSSRLLFVSKSSSNALDVTDIKAVNVEPWETIFIYDRTGLDLLVAIRYYYINVLSDNDSVKAKLKLEIYDKTSIYYYVENDNSTFDIDTSEELNPRTHLFDNVPLFEFKNNNERQGDCDKVLALIDTYDKTVSDLSSELEQFRLAYIALFGLKASKADLDKLRQTGMFEMTKEGKVEFVTKDINIDQIMSYLNKLENNIVRFAKSVNFKDENFYGNLSGIAIRYKLMQLEEKAMTTQVKFEVADSYMWKLLEPMLNFISNIEFSYLYIERQFTRNIPVNLLEEARIQTELEGSVSTKTRLSVASFVQNADIEYQELLEEKKLHKKLGVDIVAGNDVTKARLVDLEAGGPTNRNTNGTVEGQ